MYVVIEIQRTGGQTGLLTWVKATREEAYQQFYTVLAAAAVSSVETHTAVILNAEGGLIDRQTFKHAPVTEE